MKLCFGKSLKLQFQWLLWKRPSRRAVILYFVKVFVLQLGVLRKGLRITSLIIYFIVGLLLVLETLFFIWTAYIGFNIAHAQPLLFQPIPLIILTSINTEIPFPQVPDYWEADQKLIENSYKRRDSIKAPLHHDESAICRSVHAIKTQYYILNETPPGLKGDGCVARFTAGAPDWS